MSKINKQPLMYAVISAHYLKDDVPIPMPGVPEYNNVYFGAYTGKFPYEAASKAFTGLQKHMKKFPTWFPGYNEDAPYDIIFILEDANGTRHGYHGARVEAHQGTRERTFNGRKSIFRWDNLLTKWDLA